MSNNFRRGTTGHAIVDDVVVENQDRNIEAFEQLKEIPIYFGDTNIGIDTVALTQVKDKEKISLLHDLKMTYASRAGEPCTGYVIRETEDGQQEKVECSSAIVWLIKVCAAGSINVSEVFSCALSEFARRLTYCCERPEYIELKMQDSLSKYLEKELNSWLTEICDKYEINRLEEISTKKGKALEKLLNAASSGSADEV